MQTYTQGEALSILTQSPPEQVKSLAEDLLPELGDVHVLQSRTGLVMLPYVESAQGAVFHLGEVLVAEAHIQLPDGTQGYGMITGRDVTFAMAVAVLDAALTAGVMTEAINTFLHVQQQAQAAADDALLRQVEATRVEMETF